MEQRTQGIMRSKKEVTGRLREVACAKIDEQTEALAEMIGKNQIDYRIVYYAVLFGGSAVIVDPKSECGNWKETLPEIAHEINIVNLTSEAKNKGLLDPYVIMKNLKDAESLVIDELRKEDTPTANNIAEHKVFDPVFERKANERIFDHVAKSIDAGIALKRVRYKELNLNDIVDEDNDF